MRQLMAHTSFAMAVYSPVRTCFPCSAKLLPCRLGSVYRQDSSSGAVARAIIGACPESGLPVLPCVGPSATATTALVVCRGCCCCCCCCCCRLACWRDLPKDVWEQRLAIACQLWAPQCPSPGLPPRRPPAGGHDKSICEKVEPSARSGTSIREARA